LEADVLIIGAGAAGLAAASRLARSRHSALVLEARDRIGGRCWSRETPGLAVPVELGAEFIHGRSRTTFDLLRQAGLAAVDANGPHWFPEQGRLRERDDLFDEIRKAMGQARSLEKKDVSFAQYLERDLRGALSDDARRFAITLVEGFDAADPELVSARSIVEEWTGAGAADKAQFRPLGGYARLLSALESTLEGSCVELQLGAIVRSVRWKRGRVEVKGMLRGAPFTAVGPRAIVTLPLGVLKLAGIEQGAVRFTPALKEKRPALAQLAVSPVIKVALQFRDAFWEKIERGRYRDAAFFHSARTAFPTFWTALPMRMPLLIAWAGGPKAARLSKRRNADLVRQAVASLESMFGGRVGAESKLEDAWVHNWQRDPYARGAYSYTTAGGEKARALLAAPLEKTLYFAGEAADSEEAGVVGGALHSGFRAAREVLAGLAKAQPPRTPHTRRSSIPSPF
jgi:monoamine oxidase